MSLVEMLGILSIIGIISAIGVIGAKHTTKNSETHKLSNNVRSLNAAVDLYLVSGGTLPSVATGSLTLEEMIVAKLKSQVNESEMHAFVGFTGSTVDPRLQAVMGNPAVGQKRAVWNIGKQKFDLVTDGIYGVKEFTFGEAEAIVDEDRDQFVKYANTGNWVWEYTEDYGVSPHTAPDTIATSGVIGGGLADTAGHEPSTLAPPTYSMASGAYDIELFSPGVEITNPNSPGLSVIYYSIDGGASWYHHYEETKSIFLASYPSNVRAYALSIDPDNWIDSNVSEENYMAIRDPMITVTGSVSTTAP